MAKRVFFSFHYQPDNWRAATVRSIGAIDGSSVATDNEWEAIKKGGDSAIQKWIDGQISGKSCGIVLIGAQTAGRKWINYEIKKCWDDGKGLLGIYIHNLKDSSGNQSSKGADPFATFTLKNGTVPLTSVVKTYDPPYTDSKSAYNYIATNLASWIDAAVTARSNYK
ncbi:MAG: TIR domain-containing protein [Terrimicrobiaceae bacterium]|nr:TIR domain-containing protein [Terrimicrobiaceae bacterium]